MMTLVDLIATRKGDASYDALAERGGMSVSLLHKYATGLNKDLPRPDSISQLAKALDVTPQDIIIAAAVGLGFEMTPPDDAGSALGRLLPRDVDNLPAHSQRAILDTAHSMVTLMYGDTTAAETDPEVVAANAAARRSAAVGQLLSSRSRRSR